MNKLQPLWRNQMIWRWRLSTGLHVITQRHFYHSYFFYCSTFFLLLCCTYNSIDLFCCKSLEISFYWFHFSGENLLFDPFLFRTSTFLKRKPPKKSLCFMFTDSWWWRMQLCCSWKMTTVCVAQSANWLRWRLDNRLSIGVISKLQHIILTIAVD